uniref:Fibronectin type-III domain-containing protein n=1 Tax=Mesocestoides corti TaxID=53468 RepID=A0A5K3FXN4_MESCO
MIFGIVSSAPASVTVTPESTTSVVVGIRAPTDATGIGRYEVTVVGVEPIKSCIVPQGDKLECRVDDLQSATEYGVTVSSCINDAHPAVCSEFVTSSGWTKPHRE